MMKAYFQAIYLNIKIESQLLFRIDFARYYCFTDRPCLSMHKTLPAFESDYLSASAVRVRVASHSLPKLFSTQTVLMF